MSNPLPASHAALPKAAFPDKSLVWGLVFLNLLLELPLECIRWLFRVWGGLDEQATGLVFDGVLGVFLSPILTAMVLLVLHQTDQTKNSKNAQTLQLTELVVALSKNLKTSLTLWTPILITTFIMSFIMMGGAAIAILPGLLANYLLGLESPFALIPYGVIGATIVMVPLTFAQTLVVIEKMTPWQARFRSRQLAQNKRPLLVAFFLVMVLLPEGLSLFVEEISKGAATAAQGLISAIQSMPLETAETPKTSHIVVTGDAAQFWSLPEIWGVTLRLILGTWWLVAVIGSYHLYAQSKSHPRS